MKRSVAVIVSIMVVAPLFAASFPAWAKRGDVRARFSYTVPERDEFRGPSAAAFLAGHPFRVQAQSAADAAGADRRVVGSREQERGSAEIYTREDVPLFVTGALAQTLAAWGAKVVDSAPDLVLGVAVDDFFLSQGDDVSARLAIRLRLTTPDGVELWQGKLAGAGYAGTDGSTSDRYDEAVGKALTDVIARLVDDPGPMWAVGRASRDAAGTRPAAKAPAAARPAGNSAAAATTGAGVFGPGGVPVITQSVVGGPARLVVGGATAAAAPAPSAVAKPEPAAVAPSGAAGKSFTAELLRLAQAGADHDLMLAFANQSPREDEPEITADDVLTLKSAGIPDDVIRAALERPRH